MVFLFVCLQPGRHSERYHQMVFLFLFLYVCVLSCMCIRTELHISSDLQFQGEGPFLKAVRKMLQPHQVLIFHGIP